MPNRRFSWSMKGYRGREEQKIKLNKPFLPSEVRFQSIKCSFFALESKFSFTKPDTINEILNNISLLK